MYRLDDIDAWHASNGMEPPMTVDERRSLTVGDRAKLIFLVSPDAEGPIRSEAMFVKISKVTDGPRYHGHLANRPAVLEDVEYGDAVDFGPEHVLNVA